MDTNAGENGLYESLKAELGESAVQRQRLNVGDVQITTETGEAVIVERKTWHDLASSLRDGRYHNQKAAMVGAAEAGATVLYVVEGGVRGWHVTKCGDSSCRTRSWRRRSQRRPSATACRSCARPTSSTRRIVVYLAKQLVAGELQHKPVVAEPVKKRHTRDLDGATLFTHLISNVPGMSAAKATAVSKSLGVLLARPCCGEAGPRERHGGAERRVRQEEGASARPAAAAAAQVP